MLPDLNQKLTDYVARFNAEDEELYIQSVDDAHALEYLVQNAPLLECPDPVIERAFYFRWWTLRKHWKETAYGHILTEFLPPVPWAGPENSINCALGHHLREARWFRDNDGWLWEYVRFWLRGHGDIMSYSTWLADSLEAVFAVRPNPSLQEEAFPVLEALFQKRENIAKRPCGLYWSNDDRDGMEYSISGPGIRPTLNSYMYGDACALSRMAEYLGKGDRAAYYGKKAEEIRGAIERLLWDGDFYRTIPCAEGDPADWRERPDIPPEHRCRELVGYLPWFFHAAPPEHDGAFLQLKEKDGFAVPWGLTTAEQRHPRFLFKHEHECLWNGYVWPFATAQTLTALSTACRDRRGDFPLNGGDYLAMLRQYAASHTITGEDGRLRMWIDEDMHPYTGRWFARDELQRDHWNPSRGGRERGKDYNHSTFCDLVLSGLLGIHYVDGGIRARPIITTEWPYFLVTGLTEENWTVLYDRDGSRYGMGAGLHCFRAGEG